MRPKIDAVSRTDGWYLVFLTGLILVYSIYLFSFTLFDGFSTLSSDSASYVLLARKWSPWFPPDFVALHTWPVISFPPGFSWALAITGTSATLRSSHLFVSVCMLGTLAGTGWFAYRKFGWLSGGFLTLSLCLLPGVIVSSLGILSENFYLLISLLTLLVFVRIPKSESLKIFPYLLLLIPLTLALLTRSVGIALIPAIGIPALLNRKWRREHRIASLSVVTMALVFWWLLKPVSPQSGETSYGNYFGIFMENLGPGFDDVLMGLWYQIKNNLIEMVIAFKNYFSLGHPALHYFLITFGIFLLCILAAARRLVQLRPDAVYAFFYLGIIAIWPYPEEMMRFLHPLIILLVMQPFLFLHQNHPAIHGRLIGSASLTLCLIMIFSVLPIHSQLLDKRSKALATQNGLEHSFDYLAGAYDPLAERYAMALSGVMDSMSASASVVPAEGVVAAVKHEFYAVIAERASVNLTALVRVPQQLCNLKIANVEAIFISELTTTYNPLGSKIEDRFAEISTEVWSYVAVPDLVATRILKVDKQKLQVYLDSDSAECTGFMHHTRTQR